MIDRRKHPRTNIHCRVFFECSDAPDQKVSQDLGVALDISEKGMLLETSAPIHASTVKVMVPVEEEDAVEVMGNVIYSIPMPDNRYRTGIIFKKPGDGMARLVATLSCKP
jgi:hypothetical protein